MGSRVRVPPRSPNPSTIAIGCAGAGRSTCLRVASMGERLPRKNFGWQRISLRGTRGHTWRIDRLFQATYDRVGPAIAKGQRAEIWPTSKGHVESCTSCGRPIFSRGSGPSKMTSGSPLPSPRPYTSFDEGWSFGRRRIQFGKKLPINSLYGLMRLTHRRFPWRPAF